MVDSHDTTGALGGGEVVKLGESRSLVLQADELEAGAKLALGGWAANRHPEALDFVNIAHLVMNYMKISAVIGRAQLSMVARPSLSGRGDIVV